MSSLLILTAVLAGAAGYGGDNSLGAEEELRRKALRCPGGDNAISSSRRLPLHLKGDG